MNFTFRTLALLSGLLTCLGAAAQDYPNRGIRIIVASAPGGPVDITARVVAQKLSDAWKQPVVVENRAGASEIIGTEAAAKAPADGYTLLGADSLIVAGVSTSGCVRATVLDAHSYNYRCAVVEEGCFDRMQASHAMALCDMHSKYADVVKLEEAIAFIGSLPKGMFDLPSG